MSEDLSKSFTMGRVVSGDFNLYSNTQPGGNLNIAGRINAVQAIVLPLDLASLDFSTAL